MAHDSENWWKVVKTVMNVQISQNVGNSVDASFKKHSAAWIQLVGWLFGWLVSCMTSSFRPSVFEIVALLGCYAG